MWSRTGATQSVVACRESGRSTPALRAGQRFWRACCREYGATNGWRMICPRLANIRFYGVVALCEGGGGLPHGGWDRQMDLQL